MIIRKIINEEEVFEKRLRHFINKYYRIKVFQGIVLTLVIGLAITMGIVVFGNLVYAGTIWQQVILAGSLVLMIAAFAGLVIRPVAQWLGFIKGLNFKEAGKIIQKKHVSIEDRIINVIELTVEKVGTENKLYDYAIDQKTNSMQMYNFDEAIPLKKLGIFLIRLLVLSAISFGIYMLWPDFVRKGINTVWSVADSNINGRSFQVRILNDSLEVEAGKDFLLKFEVVSQFPVENVSVLIGNSENRADFISGGYEYLFKAVNSSVEFRISAGGEISEFFVLLTLKKPEISNLRITIKPPAYTGLSGSIIDGSGNAEVPAGSRVFWEFRTVGTDNAYMVINGDTHTLEHQKNTWYFNRNIYENTDYQILCNSENGLYVTYVYRITVVTDLFPSIDLSESGDSTFSSGLYIEGIVQDDYGFTKLEVITESLGKESTQEIPVSRTTIYESFYYTIIPDSNSVTYYFRIWDNDFNFGPKFTDSRKIVLKKETREEMEDQNSVLVDSIQSSLLKGMSAIEKMEKEVSQLKMEMVLGNLKPWEIQEKLKELNNLKMDVLDYLNSIVEADKEFTDNEEFLNLDETITDRAREIQELMESLMDDELRDLLQQLDELAKEFNSKKADELTDKLEMNLEKLKEQMEMSLELLKKYEMEKELIEQSEQLEQLADSLQNEKSWNDSLATEYREDLKLWENRQEDILERDKLLKQPYGLEDLEKEREDVQKAFDELDNCKSGKSCDSERAKGVQSLKRLSKKLQDMLGMMRGEAQAVDLEEIRQIRNSLNDYSKRQEDLNSRILKINTLGPIFTEVIKGQKELEVKFTGIRDSLKSIGYKQPIVAKMIGSELFHVETSQKNLFKSYSENRANIVRVEQNRIMSEVNMIAVKLDELIKNMQNANGSGEGKKGFTDRKKQKSGDKKGSEKLGETQSKQESLKEQLRNSIEKMKSGTGGKKERGEMARMLGEREMMRKALEKILQDGGLGNAGREKANEALKMMMEVEKDIIYNRLGEQTLQKDKLITTKLLEAENSEKERESENRRESKEFRGNFEPNRRELDKSLEQKGELKQVLKYKELKLRKFYQERYQKYIESTKK